MRESSSVRTATRRSYRAASLIFFALTVYMAVIFVAALGEREIRSGVFTYALITAITAVGLFMVRRWGRMLALVFALANAALGVVSLAAVLIAGEGELFTASLVTGISVVMILWLSRRVFLLPDDYAGRPADD